jgi:hypothetical protein
MARKKTTQKKTRRTRIITQSKLISKKKYQQLGFVKYCPVPPDNSISKTSLEIASTIPNNCNCALYINYKYPDIFRVASYSVNHFINFCQGKKDLSTYLKLFKQLNADILLIQKGFPVQKTMLEQGLNELDKINELNYDYLISEMEKIGYQYCALVNPNQSFNYDPPENCYLIEAIAIFSRFPIIKSKSYRLPNGKAVIISKIILMNYIGLIFNTEIDPVSEHSDEVIKQIKRDFDVESINQAQENLLNHIIYKEIRDVKPDFHIISKSLSLNHELNNKNNKNIIRVDGDIFASVIKRNFNLPYNNYQLTSVDLMFKDNINQNSLDKIKVEDLAKPEDNEVNDVSIDGLVTQIVSDQILKYNHFGYPWSFQTDQLEGITETSLFNYYIPIKYLNDNCNPYYQKLLQDSHNLSGKSIEFSEKKMVIYEDILLQYVKSRPNIKILILWNIDKIPHYFKNYGELVYQKLFKFSSNNNIINGFLYEIYDFQTKKDLITQISKLRYPKTALVLWIDYKTKVIPLPKINDPFYYSRTWSKTIELSAFFLNPNTIDFLKKQRTDRLLLLNDKTTHWKLNTFKKIINSNLTQSEINNLCILSGITFFSYGMRKFNDIDANINMPTKNYKNIVNVISNFFSKQLRLITSSDFYLLTPEKISSLDQEYIKKHNVMTLSQKNSKNIILTGQDDYTQLIYNPEHHYYFKGIKLLQVEYSLLLRFERYSMRALSDIVLFNYYFNQDLKIPRIPETIYNYGQPKKINTKNKIIKGLLTYFKMYKKCERYYSLPSFTIDKVDKLFSDYPITFNQDPEYHKPDEDRENLKKIGFIFKTF